MKIITPLRSQPNNYKKKRKQKGHSESVLVPKLMSYNVHQQVYSLSNFSFSSRDTKIFAGKILKSATFVSDAKLEEPRQPQDTAVIKDFL